MLSMMVLLMPVSTGWCAADNFVCGLCTSSRCFVPTWTGCCAPSAVANSATVWCSKSISGVSCSPASPALAMICRLWMEAPPRAKKLSWIPTLLIPRTWAQMLARTSSTGLRGATKASSSLGRSGSGAGRALRSTLPLVNNGKASRKTKAAGIM